jgi:hypothetical protein
VFPKPLVIGPNEENWDEDWQKAGAGADGPRSTAAAPVRVPRQAAPAVAPSIPSTSTPRLSISARGSHHTKKYNDIWQIGRCCVV